MVVFAQVYLNMQKARQTNIIRSELHDQVKAGQVFIADLVEDERVRSMMVKDLLRWQWPGAFIRCDKIFDRMKLKPLTTLAEMHPRRRALLAQTIRSVTPRGG